MYEAFYGLTEKPFSLLPDPGFLFLGRQHSMAFSMLEYGMLNRAGFTVITGDIGCGKTTLIRHLLNQLDEGVNVGLISNTHEQIDELLRWVLLAFRLDYKANMPIELFDTFTKFLIDQYAKGRRTVLIVDEAQNLRANTLEELRMLSNINADKDLLLQLVLVGQPALRRLLRQPELAQFAQRVLVDFHIKPLSEKETIQYIQHRVKIAGRDDPLFTLGACGLIFIASKGVPRVINMLCDTALVYAFAEALPKVYENVVEQVFADKEEFGALGLDSLDNALDNTIPDHAEDARQNGPK